MVESVITLAVGTEVEPTIVELATLDEIELYISQFNEEQPTIKVTFTGPIVVETDVTVRLRGVSRVMNEMERLIFERTLLGLLFPLGEGAVATDASVYLQSLRGGDRRNLQTLTEPTLSNVVSTRVRGTCRGCASDRFSSLVDEVMQEKQDELKSNLEANGANEGTPYFENVTSTPVSESNETDTTFQPNELTTFTEASLTAFPYWILTLLGGAALVVTVGFCYVGAAARRGKQEFLERERQRYLANRKDIEVSSPLSDRRKSRVSPSTSMQ